MGRFEGALKASLILTRNHFSTQSLAQMNQRLALEERGEVEWMLKEVFVSWLVSNEWGGRRRAFILRLKTSCYCAESSTLGTSDTVSVLPRGYLETQQWKLISSSDPGSVLPTPWQKLASEVLSDVPTQCRYYRQKLRFLEKKSKVYVLTLNFSHSLGSSPRALLASLGYQFVSPFIVRCFLYLNSKSKIKLSLGSSWKYRLGVGGLPFVKTMIFIHLSPTHILIKH
jgi:hypothetical protein